MKPHPSAARATGTPSTGKLKFYSTSDGVSTKVGVKQEFSPSPDFDHPMLPIQNDVNNNVPFSSLENSLVQYSQQLNPARVFDRYAREAARGGPISLDQSALKELAGDLHAMQKDAQARAFKLDGAMRSLRGVDGQQFAVFDNEAFYTEAVAILHSHDISDDPLGNDLGSDSKYNRLADSTAPRRRRRGEGGTAAAGAGPKPSKKQSAKQQQQQLKEHAEFVESWMGFPAAVELATVKPCAVEPSSLNVPPLGEHWQRAEIEARYKEDRELELRAKDLKDGKTPNGASTIILPTDSSTEKEQKKKEKKREKERKQREAAKEAKKFQEAQRLSILHLDREQRKRALNLEQNLGGSTAFHAPLLHRLLACLIEMPQGARPSPHTAAASSQAHTANGTHPSASKAPSKTVQKKKKGGAAEADISDRLRLELRSCGLEQLASIDVEAYEQDSERADDPLAAELRAAQAELQAHNESLNTTRSLFFSLGTKISDHPQRLKGLEEAEHMVLRTAKNKKRKSYEKAVEGHNKAELVYGTRRQITGFIPHPLEMGGVPRAIAKAVQDHPGYLAVLNSNKLQPLPVNTGQMTRHANASYASQMHLSSLQNETYRALTNSSLQLSTGISPSPFPHAATFSPGQPYTSNTSPMRLSDSPNERDVLDTSIQEDPDDEEWRE